MTKIKIEEDISLGVFIICPNCGIDWGCDEIDTQCCDACGYPDEDDDFDEDDDINDD